MGDMHHGRLDRGDAAPFADHRPCIVGTESKRIERKPNAGRVQPSREQRDHACRLDPACDARADHRPAHGAESQYVDRPVVRDANGERLACHFTGAVVRDGTLSPRGASAHGFRPLRV